MSNEYSSAPELTLADACAILRLRFGATDRDVTAAYRRLSLKFHPDKRLGDPNATSRFQTIVAAYEMILHHFVRLADPDYWILNCSMAEYSIYTANEDFKSDQPDVEASYQYRHNRGRWPTNERSSQYVYGPDTQYNGEQDAERFQYSHAEFYQSINEPNGLSEVGLDAETSKTYNEQRFRWYYEQFIEGTGRWSRSHAYGPGGQPRNRGNRSYGNHSHGTSSYGYAGQDTHARNQPYTSNPHSQPYNGTEPRHGDSQNGANDPGYASQTRYRNRPNTYGPDSCFHNEERPRHSNNGNGAGNPGYAGRTPQNRSRPNSYGSGSHSNNEDRPLHGHNQDSVYNHSFTNQNTNVQSPSFDHHDLERHYDTPYPSQHRSRVETAARRWATNVDAHALNNSNIRFAAHLERENWRERANWRPGGS